MKIFSMFNMSLNSFNRAILNFLSIMKQCIDTTGFLTVVSYIDKYRQIGNESFKGKRETESKVKREKEIELKS